MVVKKKRPIGVSSNNPIFNIWIATFFLKSCSPTFIPSTVFLANLSNLVPVYCSSIIVAEGYLLIIFFVLLVHSLQLVFWYLLLYIHKSYICHLKIKRQKNDLTLKYKMYPVKLTINKKCSTHWVHFI